MWCNKIYLSFLKDLKHVNPHIKEDPGMLDEVQLFICKQQGTEDKKSQIGFRLSQTAWNHCCNH